MIKPRDIDFSTPLAALKSYEAARFAGYDLEASEEDPVVLEEHEAYTLIGIKLKTASGREVIRKVKAYKNGENEVVDPEEEPEAEEPEAPVAPTYAARLSTTEDGAAPAPVSLTEGDITYVVITTTDLVDPTDVNLTLAATGLVATAEVGNPITLTPGQVKIVPVMIETVTEIDATLGVTVLHGADTVATIAAIPVAQAGE